MCVPIYEHACWYIRSTQCASAFVPLPVCMQSCRIYSLWHVRVLQPLKTYQSSGSALLWLRTSTLRVYDYFPLYSRLARSYRMVQSFGVAADVRCLVESNIPGKWSLFDRFRCQLFPCLTANYVFFILLFFHASSLRGICGSFFVRTFRTDLLTLINRSWKRRVELFVRRFFVHSEERYS